MGLEKLAEKSVKPARQVKCWPTEYGLYRYWLEIKLPGDGLALSVIMKNPSTASASRSDATIGKVEAWASRRNYRAVTIVNLFGYRSPYPEKLNDFDYAFIVGAENDFYIRKALAENEVTIAAWGNANGINPLFYSRRINEILQLVGTTPLKIVGELTQQGQPRHARVWNNNPPLLDYQISAAQA